jgi:hypothetical protein
VAKCAQNPEHPLRVSGQARRLPEKGAGSNRPSDRSRDAKLAIVKTVHTAIYVVQMAATAYILVAGVTGRNGRHLRLAFALVTVESMVFLASGRRCPLTALAQKYGDPKGYVGDSWFSARCTRHNFGAFASLLALGTGLVLIRRLRGDLRWIHARVARSGHGSRCDAPQSLLT